MFFNQKPEYYSQQFEDNLTAIKNEDYNYIPVLFCVFAEHTNSYKYQAAFELNKILNKLTITEIIKIDKQMRQRTSMEWFIDWNKQKIDNFLTKQMSNELRRAVLIFAASNPNGHIREQAVKALANYKDTLPFILLRCNDWVSQVQEAAETAFQYKLKNVSEQEILFALPLIEKLYKSSRCNYSKILSTMVAAFIKNESLIKKALRSPDPRVRRNCIFILEQASLPYEEYFIKHLKYEKEPYIRRMIYQKFMNSDDYSCRLVELGLNDKNAYIRRMVLQFLYEHDLYKATTVSEQMLLDKNASVRDWARWIIKKQRNEFDFHQFYITRMDTNTSVCLYGLGEVGTLDDCPMIEKFLHDTNMHIVGAAMCSLMSLNPDKYISQVTEVLLSEKLGVVKMAWMLLKKSGGFDFERVYQIHINTSCEYTKIKCISLLCESPKWKKLIYLLKMLGSDSKAVERECAKQIQKWIDDFNRYNSYQIVLSEDDNRTIRQLLMDKKCFLKAEIMKQIQFVCR